MIPTVDEIQYDYSVQGEFLNLELCFELFDLQELSTKVKWYYILVSYTLFIA